MCLLKFKFASKVRPKYFASDTCMLKCLAIQVILGVNRTSFLVAVIIIEVVIGLISPFASQLSVVKTSDNITCIII